MNRADKYGLEMKDVLQQHLSNTAETEIVEDDSPFTDIEIELDGYYEELFQKLLHIGDIPKVDVPTSLKQHFVHINNTALNGCYIYESLDLEHCY